MLLLRLEDGRDASVNRIKILILSVAVAGLAAGLAAPAFGLADWRAAIWGASSAIVLAALLAEIARSLPRGEVGLDLVASLSMATALAFGETLAGAVVSLMYAGGQVLDGDVHGQGFLGWIGHSGIWPPAARRSSPRPFCTRRNRNRRARPRKPRR